jgi:energy-coupling factor transporter ATP-binding protein EcfA2
MKYTSFFIKNYKGIQELTLDLNKDPKSNVITLVGLNESGKTSILEAISLLSNDIPDDEKHKLIPKDKKFNFTDTIEITATLELDSSDTKKVSDYIKGTGFRRNKPSNTFTITKELNFQSSKFISEHSQTKYLYSFVGLKKGQQYERSYDFSSEEALRTAESIYENLYPTLIYYPNFLFDFPEKIFLEHYNDEDEEQAIYRSVLNDILDTFGEGLSIKEHIVERLRSSDKGDGEALEATLERMGTQITSVVFSAWGEIFDSQGKEIRIKANIDSESDRCFLEVKLKEGTNQYQISERSLGFKWFFTFLLFTEFRKNRASEQGEIIFLLDEPASNLHSTAQKKLLNTFERLVTNCKLIYTTHSHHLINPKWLEGAYVVKNGAIDYESFSSPIIQTKVEAVLYKQFAAHHPEQKTYFQPILDCIEYQPGLLEEVPNIIITEGKNDYYTFRYINEIMLGGYNTELKFYPGSGADRNNQIIATYLAWSRDFVILLDGDVAGEKAKKRYLADFGLVVESKIITLKDIDKSFSFATEDLFTETEKLEITKIYDATASIYEKSKFNTAIQTLLIQEEETNISSETLEKFAIIFEVLK